MTRKTLIATGILFLCMAGVALATAAKKSATPASSKSAKSNAKTTKTSVKATKRATSSKSTAKRRKTSTKTSSATKAKTATKSSAKKTTVSRSKSSAKTTRVRSTKTYKKPARRYYSPWDTPTYADSTYGDSVDGEDLVVRRAAVAALGPLNGSVIVADPMTGRILTMVNQKLALTGAYQPCSTIKLVAGVAALNEGLIDRETRVRLGRRYSMNLTYALAKSNNPYFAKLGDQLGFDKVYYYARQMGLGERAGLEIEGESPGLFPDQKPAGVSVGLMTSFGEAIGLTPLQLTAVMTAIANGGTLYYLQYPKSQEAATGLEPRVKRYLDLQTAIPEMKPGMLGAVDYGTARRALYDMNEPIFGKTGTCTDARTHLGWFGSFNEVAGRKLVVVVLLTGGRYVNGPVASGVAGQVYKLLSQQQYFQTDPSTVAKAPVVTNAGDSGEALNQ